MTSGPRNHFFGYYGIQPWDVTGRYLLSLEVAYHDHPPRPGEKAIVGMIELASAKYIPLAETTAWNFQQGAMMQWLPSSPDSEIIFNDGLGDRAVSVILNVHTGERRVLGRAISALSHDGKTALTLNFGRLQYTRPGYGYAGVSDPFRGTSQPSDDGIYLLDLESGEEVQVITLGDVFTLNKPAKLGQRPVFLNHTMYNPIDSRFAFLVGWKHYPLPNFWRLRKLGRLKMAMFTAAVDGDDLRCVIDYGKVSHYDWRNSKEILVWAKLGGRECFHLVTDGQNESKPIAQDLLTRDGHCSFSPNGHWVLVDTYPDQERLSTLKLYNWDEGTQIILGNYYSDAMYAGEIRCDLHPRWNRTGTEICFDSIHEGSRQIYVMDVSRLVCK